MQVCERVDFEDQRSKIASIRMKCLPSPHSNMEVLTLLRGHKKVLKSSNCIQALLHLIFSTMRCNLPPFSIQTWIEGCTLEAIKTLRFIRAFYLLILRNTFDSKILRISFIASSNILGFNSWWVSPFCTWPLQNRNWKFNNSSFDIFFGPEILMGPKF